MAEDSYPKVGQFQDVSAFIQHLKEIDVELPCDQQIESAADSSPLAQSFKIANFTIGNRWCIHPMEGWDGTPDGQPTNLTLRRWQHFGESGAKLIWGGEAFAVQNDGRANPNQLAIVDQNYDRAESGLRRLLDALVSAHRATIGNTDDLFIGLQLTHSGRFCKPNSKTNLEPRIAYHHPFLDPKFGIAADDDSSLISDDYIRRLIENYIRAAKLAQKVGFHFVDLKHCHGYLGHELLSAFTRPGPYGGSLENRTRFAREIIQGIQAECPSLAIAVRLSAFDAPPFLPDPARSTPGKLGPGIPQDLQPHLPYNYGFGLNPDHPLEIDLAEPIQFINMLARMNVKLINASGGSPYYCPHIQRPAIFPPSDGYQPPEDPLVGVARQIHATRQIKTSCPNSIFVGTGYSYLQEYLPHVAQAVVRAGWTDFVGLGRLALSYWELPADTLAGRAMQTRRICRTFSDCTTAPRNGIVSGCYPLDPFYKSAPEADELKQKKAELRKRLAIQP